MIFGTQETLVPLYVWRIGLVFHKLFVYLKRRIYNPKAVQSTMGSIFHVNLVTMDLGEVLANNEVNKPAKVFGALLEGENIYLKDNFTSGILVIGNESNGISSKNLKFISDNSKNTTCV